MDGKTEPEPEARYPEGVVPRVASTTSTSEEGGSTLLSTAAESQPAPPPEEVEGVDTPTTSANPEGSEKSRPRSAVIVDDKPSEERGSMDTLVVVPEETVLDSSLNAAALHRPRSTSTTSKSMVIDGTDDALVPEEEDVVPRCSSANRQDSANDDAGVGNSTGRRVDTSTLEGAVASCSSSVRNEETGLQDQHMNAVMMNETSAAEEGVGLWNNLQADSVKMMLDTSTPVQQACAPSSPPTLPSSAVYTEEGVQSPDHHSVVTTNDKHDGREDIKGTFLPPPDEAVPITGCGGTEPQGVRCSTDMMSDNRSFLRKEEEESNPPISDQSDKKRKERQVPGNERERKNNVKNVGINSAANLQKPSPSSELKDIDAKTVKAHMNNGGEKDKKCTLQRGKEPAARESKEEASLWMFVKIHALFNMQPSQVGVAWKCCLRIGEVNEASPNIADVVPRSQASTTVSADSQIPSWSDQLLALRLDGYQFPECKFQVVKVPRHKCGKHNERSKAVVAEATVDVIQWARDHKPRLKILLGKSHPDRRMVLGSSFGPKELLLLDEKESPRGSTLLVEWIILKSARQPSENQIVSMLSLFGKQSSSTHGVAQATSPLNERASSCVSTNAMRASVSAQQSHGLQHQHLGSKGKLNIARGDRVDKGQANKNSQKEKNRHHHGIGNKSNKNPPPPLSQKWEKWIRRNKTLRAHGAGAWDIKSKRLVGLLDKDIRLENQCVARSREHVLTTYEKMRQRLAEKMAFDHDWAEKRCQRSCETLRDMNAKRRKVDAAVQKEREEASAHGILLYQQMQEKNQNEADLRSQATEGYAKQCREAGVKYEKLLLEQSKAASDKLNEMREARLVSVQMYLERESSGLSNSNIKPFREEVMSMRAKCEELSKQRLLEKQPELLKLEERRNKAATVYESMMSKAHDKKRSDEELLANTHKGALQSLEKWKQSELKKQQELSDGITLKVARALVVNEKMDTKDTQAREDRRLLQEARVLENQRRVERYCVANHQAKVLKMNAAAADKARLLDMYQQWDQQQTQDAFDRKQHEDEQVTKLANQMKKMWEKAESTEARDDARKQQDKEASSNFVSEYRKNIQVEMAKREDAIQGRVENAVDLWCEMENKRNKDMRSNQMEVDKKREGEAIRFKIAATLQQTDLKSKLIEEADLELRLERGRNAVTSYQARNVADANLALQTASEARRNGEAMINLHAEMVKEASQKKEVGILERRAWAENYSKKLKYEKDGLREKIEWEEKKSTENVKSLLDKMDERRKHKEKEIEKEREARVELATTLYETMYGVKK
jgi:hypothetical protein